MRYENNTDAIGGTPLVRLGKLGKGLGATVWGKVEGRNPGYSVKCRIGVSMIRDAEERGVLSPGMTVVEPTSGNTGIALAFVCAAKGYPLTLTMPETMSMERRRVLAAFGARLVLTPGAEGMPGAIRRAEAMVAADPKAHFMPQQFKNPANPRIHELTTGPEILADLDGRVDAVVAGVGTGGTLTGISRFLKTVRRLPVLSVAVEPSKCPVLTQHRAGKPLTTSAHKIQGIGAGFVPEVLDMSLVDRIETVTDEEALETARRLTAVEGILSGISCGAATAVGLRLAALPELAGKNIVVILPDSGERYLSTPLFDAP